MTTRSISSGSKNTELRYLAGVSWPRSGHHLVARVLMQYFRGWSSFGYCEFYNPELCCGRFPCARTGLVHFSKNHDRDFDVPQIDGMNYLIQYRDFSSSVVSNFELHVRNGSGPDTSLEFRRFASSEWSNYKKFIEKWVTSDFARSQMVLDYDDLSERPYKAFKEIIQMIAPSIPIKKIRLLGILWRIQGVTHSAVGGVKTGRGVKARRVVQDFRYYEPHLFSLLKRLNLTREDVIRSHREVLGREPDEGDILGYQCCRSETELLEKFQDQHIANG